MTIFPMRLVCVLALSALLAVACGSDADIASAEQVDALEVDVESLTTRLALYDVPGRHAEVWDAMFNQDVEAARTLLGNHITNDSVISFKFPDGDLDSPPGPDGWIGVVTQSGAAGGWTAAAPGFPTAMHNAGSPQIVSVDGDRAELRSYVRATHYKEDSSVDISEGILDFDLVFDDDAKSWLVARLDLTPLSLRSEGGQVLPPVTG